MNDGDVGPLNIVSELVTVSNSVASLQKNISYREVSIERRTYYEQVNIPAKLFSPERTAVRRWKLFNLRRDFCTHSAHKLLLTMNKSHVVVYLTTDVHVRFSQICNTTQRDFLRILP